MTYCPQLLYYALYIIIVNKYGCWISDVKNSHVFFLSSLQFDCVVHALRCMRYVTLRFVAINQFGKKETVCSWPKGRIG